MGSVLLAALVVALQASAPETITEAHPDGSPRSRCEARRDDSGNLVRHGLYEAWYPDGRLEARGTFVDGLEQGEWELWHPNGKRAAEGSYERGQRSGIWTSFTEQGPRSCEGEYIAGRRDGSWKFYDWEARPGAGAVVRKVSFSTTRFAKRDPAGPGPGSRRTG